jgi:hypothetical protein
MTNKSISQLNSGSAVSDTDLFPDVQTVGIGPVKVTGAQIKTFTSNSPTLVTPAIGVATGTSLALGGATIGTNALAISGTSAMGSATYFPDGSQTDPSIAHSGDTNCGIFFPAADSIAFTTSGTEKGRFISNGYLGLGLTSPAVRLTVRGAEGTTSYLTGSFIGGTNGYGSFLHYSDGFTYNFGVGTDTNGDFKWFSGRFAGNSGTNRFTVSQNGNIVVGNDAIATNATDGFLYVPTCAGQPTGIPSAYTGRSAVVYDTTGNKLYIYNGGWKSATFS